MIQINVDKYPYSIKKMNNLLLEYEEYSYDEDFRYTLDSNEVYRIAKIFQDAYTVKEDYYRYRTELQKVMVDSMEKTYHTDEIFYAADPRQLSYNLTKAIELKYGEKFIEVLDLSNIIKVKVIKQYYNSLKIPKEEINWHGYRYIVKIIDFLKRNIEFKKDTIDISGYLSMMELNKDSEYIIAIDKSQEEEKYDCKLVDQEIKNHTIEGKNWDMRDYTNWEKFKIDFRNKFILQ